MIRINLLPWREARRKAHNLQFFILMGMVAGLAGSIVLLVHGYYATQISTQMERNRFLKEENKKLDKEIEEIKKLKTRERDLLDRVRELEEKNMAMLKSPDKSMEKDLSRAFGETSAELEDLDRLLDAKVAAIALPVRPASLPG